MKKIHLIFIVGIVFIIGFSMSNKLSDQPANKNVLLKMNIEAVAYAESDSVMCLIGTKGNQQKEEGTFLVLCFESNCPWWYIIDITGHDFCSPPPE